jgi:hypothetical protein
VILLDAPALGLEACAVQIALSETEPVGLGWTFKLQDWTS